MVGFKRGKHVPRHDARTLRFAKYAAGLAAPPAQVEWQSKVPSYGMDGNESVGNCTIVGAAHLIETWSYNAGGSVNFSTQDCLNDYYALTGGPDTGLDLLTVLQAWQSKGLGYGGTNPAVCGLLSSLDFFTTASPVMEDKISAYTALKAGNQVEAQQAISLLAGIYIGLELPDFVVNASNPLTIPWSVPNGGAVGVNAPNPQNGHCVAGVGYTQNSLFAVTWGAVIEMTWEFYQAYSDEAYAILSPDWFNAGLSPNGLDVQQLQTDLEEIQQS